MSRSKAIMLPRLNIGTRRRVHTHAATYQAMLRREAALGGQLFGPVPEGIRREFVCLNERTWLWHEEWIDNYGHRQHRTTRYDVQPDGILKFQDGTGYQKLTKDEAANLQQAISLYHENVIDRLYGHQQ